MLEYEITHVDEIIDELLTAEFAFDIPEELGAPSGESLYDLLAEESVPAVAGGRIRVSVPGLTARLLTQTPPA